MSEISAISTMTDTEKSVMASYDRLASQLVADNIRMLADPFFRSYFDNWARQIIHMTDMLGKGASVLALGAGTAFDAPLFTRRGLTYTGIDFSAETLRIARQQDTIRVARMNMRNLGFTDNSFDGVWLWDAMIHLADEHVGPTMAEIGRVTKLGGYISISMLNNDFGGVGLKGTHLEENGQMVNFRSPEQNRLAMEENGLKVVEIIDVGNPELTFIAQPSRKNCP